MTLAEYFDSWASTDAGVLPSDMKPCAPGGTELHGHFDSSQRDRSPSVFHPIFPPGIIEVFLTLILNQICIKFRCIVVIKFVSFYVSLFA